RLLVEALAPREPAQLVDQLTVGATIGGAHADVHTALRPLTGEMVRSGGTGIDVDGQHLRSPPGEDLDLGNDPGGDGVAYEVGHALLQIERACHPTHVPAPVLHAHDQRPACRV